MMFDMPVKNIYLAVETFDINAVILSLIPRCPLRVRFTTDWHASKATAYSAWPQ